jgi:hypothetical protein
MEEPIRARDLAEASGVIATLQDQLREANTDLAKWKIELLASVYRDQMTNEISLKVTVTKPNGQGFIRSYDQEQLLYVANDPYVLITALTDEIIENLLLKTIREEITTPISNAVKNGVRMIQR